MQYIPLNNNFFYWIRWFMKDFFDCITPFSGSAKIDSDLLYEKLSQVLRDSGCEHAGMALPSERCAAEKLKCDRSVVHRVYNRLIGAGMIRRAPGSYAYIINHFSGIHSGQCIGIVMPDIFSKFIQAGLQTRERLHLYLGIAERAAEYHLGIIPLQLPPPDSKPRELEHFFKQHLAPLAGVIHLCSRGVPDDTALDALWRNKPIPQVCLMMRNKYAHCGSCSFDSEFAIKLVCEEFRSLGHRRAALFFSSRQDSFGVHYDLQNHGEVAALFNSYGVDVREEWCFAVDPETPEAMSEAVDKLLREPILPQAIWCRSDWLAFEAINQLKKRNFNVPEHFSVIGTEDQPESEFFSPPLSTVHLPFYTCGRKAVDQLIELRKNGPGTAMLFEKALCRLEKRGSTGLFKEVERK